MKMQAQNQIDPLAEYRKQLPFRLIQYTCFNCDQSGWIPEVRQVFHCFNCGQGLRFTPGPTVYKSDKVNIDLENMNINKPMKGAL